MKRGGPDMVNRSKGRSPSYLRERAQNIWSSNVKWSSPLGGRTKLGKGKERGRAM